MEGALAARLRRRRDGFPVRGRVGQRGRLTALLRKPRWQTVLLAAAAVGVLCGGFAYFRTSPLVRIEHVQISGVHGAYAEEIESALAERAGQMSTMAASASGLAAAVARFHVVRSVSIRTSFPHGAEIEVTEQLPVATLRAGQGRTAVAANGVVLGPALASSTLPSVSIGTSARPGQTIAAAKTRALLTLLGAAPGPLRAMVSKVYEGPEGLTIRMSNRLLVYFGNATRPHAKWAALAAVLSNPASAGAGYVDVRLPERPAAGLGSEATAAGPGDEVGATDPSSSVLAESLARAVGGGAVESPQETNVASESVSSGTAPAGSTVSSGSGEEPAAPYGGAVESGAYDQEAQPTESGLAYQEPSSESTAPVEAESTASAESTESALTASGGAEAAP